MKNVNKKMGADTVAGSENATGEKPSNNPLSRKINKILETRLENDKVKYILQTISKICVRKVLP